VLTRALSHRLPVERGEVEPIVALLTEDAWLTMPPEPVEYQGRDAIEQFIAHASAARWDQPHRLIPTRANSQPAFGHNVKDSDAEIGRALGRLVLTLDAEHISHITRFAATTALSDFGLPRTIP
jgi:RNA polymerase sigma-70 factor (ECF subfamily)